MARDRTTLNTQRGGRGWSDEDRAELARLAAEGVPLANIAKALGRSRESIATRARVEGVAITYPPRK